MGHISFLFELKVLIYWTKTLSMAKDCLIARDLMQHNALNI
jgi:hypothetical protein